MPVPDETLDNSKPDTRSLDPVNEPHEFKPMLGAPVRCARCAEVECHEIHVRSSNSLLQRLRHWSREDDADIGHEAANELERLQREVARLQTDLIGAREVFNAAENLSNELKDTRAALAACNRVLQEERTAHESVSDSHED